VPGRPSGPGPGAGLLQGEGSQQGRRSQAVAAPLFPAALDHSLSRGLCGPSLLLIFFLSEASCAP
jgi:hypothetical protein